MIYYCIYKDECSFKDCIYRQTKSKYSIFGAKKDLTVNSFTCNSTRKKGTRLVSDERIICDRYKKCIVNCFLKTTYITINNFERHFGYEFYSPKSFKCYDASCVVNLRPAGENVGNYTSIWD